MASFISVLKVFDQEAITQNTAETKIVDLSRYNCEGFFSMQIAVVGAGTVTVTYSLSNDGTNYITPSGTSALFTTFGATSGESSDGKSLVSFDPPLAKYIKIIATENNAGAITTLDLHLAIQ
jgi:hypothetical protein